ncbi:signal peptidase I [Alphaproteobacteria bacterium]
MHKKNIGRDSKIQVRKSRPHVHCTSTSKKRHDGTHQAASIKEGHRNNDNFVNNLKKSEGKHRSAQNDVMEVESGIDSNNQKKPDTFLDYVKVVIVAVALALLLRSFVFEPFKIPSGSMKPTLLIGDRLIVSKYPYGYGNYSMPFLSLHLDRPLLDALPTRGDIIVFRSTKDGDDKAYIKRLIGLSGDEIEVIHGILHINGVAVKLRKIGEYVEYGESGQKIVMDEYEETLPNGVKYSILDSNIDHHRNFPDNTPKYKVPEGCYFFMGDNRNHSADSRYIHDMGFIPDTHLIGRAEFIFWNTTVPLWKWVLQIEKNPRIFTTLRNDAKF